jgi:hypothetical protein
MLLHSYFGAVDPITDDAPIQIFKLLTIKQMTQQDKVIKVFLDLLNKGSVTTLDVKLKLRDDYFTEYWNQDFVSVVLSDYQNANDTQIRFDDNGHFRTYYKTLLQAKITPVSSSSTYSYTTNSGAVLTHNNPDVIVNIARQLGEIVHWSESKKSFVTISEMHENHLLNTIWKKTEGLSPKEFADFLSESPYVQELLLRYL